MLMIRLLHSHLHSSQGVIVENPPLPSSIFVSPNDFKGETHHSEEKHTNAISPLQQHGATMTGSRQSKIVPLECLEKIAKTLNLDSKNNSKPPANQKPLNSPSRPVANSTQLGSSPTSSHLVDSPHSTVSLPLSHYMNYDFAHSCSECSKQIRGNVVAQPAEYLSSLLPVSSDAAAGSQSQGYITIKWFVPASQQKHCLISQDRKMLERLRLPTVKFKGEKASQQPMTPIFTPTFGRDSSGLFNLFHSLPHHFHVLVTNLSDFKAYCKAWPHHIVMALPDQEVVGLGEAALLVSLITFKTLTLVYNF